MLPTETGRESLAWETSGLAPASLPDGSPVRPDTTGAYAVYRVERAEYGAVGRRAPVGTGTPFVRLADIRVAWRTDGTLLGVASFDVQPDGASQARLSLPAAYELIRVSVGGLATVPAPDGPTRWRIVLGPAELAQQVEVIFRGTAPSAQEGQRWHVPCPTLGDWEVKRTMWTLLAPDDLLDARADGGRPLTAFGVQQARLTSLSAACESAAKTGVPREDLAPWLDEWARRSAASLSAAGALFPQAETGEQAQADWTSLATRVTAAASRLGASAELARWRKEVPPAINPADLWNVTVDRRGSAVRAIADGRQAELVIVGRRALDDPASVRWAIGAALAAAIALAVVVLRRVPALGASPRWAPACGMAVGLFWWLWLWPSPFGWVIIIASLAAALRSRRTGRPEGGSSIVEINVVRR
jgi:hypothetical protein